MSPDAVAKRLRILIVDDHFVARFGLRGLLEAQPDLEVVAEAQDGSQALALYAEHRPDLVLMDSRMPGMDGAAATQAIRAAHPDARVLVLSSFDTEADVRRALTAGAAGYVMKEAEPAELLGALRAVAAGRTHVPESIARTLAQAEPARLSDREIKMLELIALGLSNREIAGHVGLTAGSVRIYASQLFEKLGVKSRGEAVAVALQRGLIRPRG